MTEYSQFKIAAVQAGAYVTDPGALLSPDLVSDAYKELACSYPGESCIIDPTGEVIAGPPNPMRDPKSERRS